MDVQRVLHGHWARLRPLCDYVELTLRTPVDKEWADGIGDAMKLRTPKELRWFLTTVAGQLGLEYTFRPNNRQLKPISMDISTGGAQFGVRSVVQTWEGWRESWDEGTVGPKAAKFRFNQLFPLLETTCGNILALLNNGRPQSAVVYLDHDGGDFDGTILAKSLMEFVEFWCAMACPDPEDLSRFYSAKSGKLSAKTEFACRWRKALGLP